MILVLINIQNFVLNPYKIKSHFLIPLTFFFSIFKKKKIGRKCWRIILQQLKMLMENCIWLKNAILFYRNQK